MRTSLLSPKTYYAIIMLIGLLMMLSLVSAVPPVQVSQSDVGLQIAYPQYQYVPINSNFTLFIHVYNVSNYITGTKANCYLELYSPSGQEVCHSLMTAGGADYSTYISTGNFTTYGQYSFIIQCNTTGQSGFASGIFEVTHSGIELTSGRALIDIGLLTMLIIFLVGCVVLFMENEHLLAKVGFLGLGYILLIAITFISWNMAQDFITSNLFVSELFRILFLTLVIGAFPLLIGAFAWYLIMLFKIKEINRLMTKGFSADEAQRRTSR